MDGHVREGVPAKELFGTRGVKGLYWSVEDYLNVARVLPDGGFNFMMLCYTMCPESCVRWRAPYPQALKDTIREIAELGSKNAVEVCLAINPIVASQTMDPSASGMPFHPSVNAPTWFRDFFIDFWYSADRFGGKKDLIPRDQLVSQPFSFSDETTFELILSKLREVREVGIRSFALCLDDLDPGLSREDKEAFGSSAAAQAYLVTRLYVSLKAEDQSAKLYFCPTYYCNRSAEAHADYIDYMARNSPSEVPWFWTGPEVISPILSREDAARFRRLSGRKPLLWMNYPCNDFLKRKLQLAPFKRPSGPLWEEVVGMAINPMVQPETSKIQILAMGRYLSDPENYEADESLEVALRDVVPAQALPAARSFFSEYSLHYPNIGSEKEDGFSWERLAELKGAAGRMAEAIAELEETLTNRRLYGEWADGLRRLELFTQALERYLEIRDAYESAPPLHVGPKGPGLAKQQAKAEELARQIAAREEEYRHERTEVGADALYLLSLIETMRDKHHIA